MGSENISLLDKLIAIFDPHTKEGRINIFRLAWIVGLFMLVLGYLIIIYVASAAGSNALIIPIWNDRSTICGRNFPSVSGSRALFRSMDYINIKQTGAYNIFRFRFISHWGKLMSPYIRRSDRRAEMGVGTMIIFIAMVLVASVAASVPIGTANQLREQATQTGVDAINGVATGIDLKYATAHVSGGTTVGSLMVTQGTAIDGIMTITLDGEELQLEVESSDSKEQIAQKIRDSATALGTWVASGEDCYVDLISTTPGIRDGDFDVTYLGLTDVLGEVTLVQGGTGESKKTYRLSVTQGSTSSGEIAVRTCHDADGESPDVIVIAIEEEANAQAVAKSIAEQEYRDWKVTLDGTEVTFEAKESGDVSAELQFITIMDAVIGFFDQYVDSDGRIDYIDLYI
ncbi:MAG TPA: hypothetical protein PKX44_06470 [Methanomassiliicoccaceae archaeon]|nr:hypothetical protein [Methanomassiliicoccaceae archaeon]